MISSTSDRSEEIPGFLTNLKLLAQKDNFPLENIHVTNYLKILNKNDYILYKFVVYIL